ncbi:hypothetical protein J1N51_11475 [Psychrosphaera ytuae]|uniref:Uncharacterized protein n=1 Tax=Psychrosphaera ytuae TaxID=2820710 RepID=A0A975HHM6_9GAMM|nr:hypothetical protein [Psychrosphaera ytuae]QTH63346.1 hypothetical protein J1N51_11475 [Psychrosphaera ytuae]
MTIQDTQYVGFSNVMIEFSKEYPLHYTNKRLHASASDCALICQNVCQRVFDLIEPQLPNGRTLAKEALINAVGVFINNKANKIKEHYVDFTNLQTEMIIKSIKIVGEQFESPNKKQREHLIETLCSRVRELKIEFGPGA